MARSKDLKTSIAINPANKSNPVTPKNATPVGLNNTLVFTLAKGWVWLSPYVTLNEPAAPFSPAVLNHEGTVSVVDSNDDNGLWTYTIHVAAVTSPDVPLNLEIDPEVQNSNSD